MGVLIETNEAFLNVADRQGLVVGMIGAIASMDLFTAEPKVTEAFWFTSPEARGDGIKLYRSLENWARSIGAETIEMIAPTRKVERAYKTMGFTKTETFYRKAL